MLWGVVNNRKQGRALRDSKLGFLMYFAQQHKISSLLQELMRLLQSSLAETIYNLCSNRVDSKLEPTQSIYDAQV